MTTDLDAATDQYQATIDIDVALDQYQVTTDIDAAIDNIFGFVTPSYCLTVLLSTNLGYIFCFQGCFFDYFFQLSHTNCNNFNVYSQRNLELLGWKFK